MIDCLGSHSIGKLYCYTSDTYAIPWWERPGWFPKSAALFGRPTFLTGRVFLQRNHDELSDHVVLILWDHDSFGEDDAMGTVVISLRKMFFARMLKEKMGLPTRASKWWTSLGVRRTPCSTIASVLAWLGTWNARFNYCRYQASRSYSHGRNRLLRQGDQNQQLHSTFWDELTGEATGEYEKIIIVSRRRSWLFAFCSHWQIRRLVSPWITNQTNGFSTLLPTLSATATSLTNTRHWLWAVFTLMINQTKGFALDIKSDEWFLRMISILTQGRKAAENVKDVQTFFAQNPPQPPVARHSKEDSVVSAMPDAVPAEKKVVMVLQTEF